MELNSSNELLKCILTSFEDFTKFIKLPENAHLIEKQEQMFGYEEIPAVEIIIRINNKVFCFSSDKNKWILVPANEIQEVV